MEDIPKQMVDTEKSTMIFIFFMDDLEVSRFQETTKSPAEAEFETHCMACPVPNSTLMVLSCMRYRGIKYRDVK